MIFYNLNLISENITVYSAYYYKTSITSVYSGIRSHILSDNYSGIGFNIFSSVKFWESVNLCPNLGFNLFQSVKF